jgi:hypothetical protein
VPGSRPDGLPFLAEVLKTSHCHRDQHDGSALV